MSQAGIASITKAVPSIPLTFTTDSGVAVPASNNLNVFGARGVTASGSGSTVTIGLQQATVTLTSAQIKTIDTIPVTIVPAQGAGTVIIPYTICSKFTYGGNNPFTDGTQISLSHGDGSTGLAFSLVMTNTQLIGTSTLYSLQMGTTTFAEIADLSNLPITANTTGGGPAYAGNAANDNTLTIQVTYYVATL